MLVAQREIWIGLAFWFTHYRLMPSLKLDAIATLSGILSKFLKNIYNI